MTRVARLAFEALARTMASNVEIHAAEGTRRVSALVEEVEMIGIDDALSTDRRARYRLTLREEDVSGIDVGTIVDIPKGSEIIRTSVVAIRRSPFTGIKQYDVVAQ